MMRFAFRLSVLAVSLTMGAALLGTRLTPGVPGGRAWAADLPSAGSQLLGAATPSISGTVPKAEVAEPVYNFGTALSGPPIKHVFTVRNVGKAPLKIVQVVTSCGCTAAKPSKEVLVPGEIATIAATVDTRLEHGHSLSVVTLATNDPGKPEIELKIEGDIKPQVTAQPADLNFGNVHHGTAANRNVLVNDLVGAKAFAIKSVKNSSPYIKVTTAKRTDGKPGAVLHVALLATMPPGPISDTLRIDTNRSPLRVAVLGTVVGDLTVKPPQVSFGILPHHQGAIRILRLTNSGPRAVKVLGVESTNNSVQAEVEPVTPGKEYKVTLALRPNTPDGQIRGSLSIKTDDPRQTTLTVPYFGIVGSFKG
jgi:Protein of unknown function (DUF1573)/Flagellar-associated PapD-like